MAAIYRLLFLLIILGMVENGNAVKACKKLKPRRCLPTKGPLWVTLSVFSGGPNPSWPVLPTSQHYGSIYSLLEQNASSPLPQDFGYRGFRVEELSSEGTIKDWEVGATSNIELEKILFHTGLSAEESWIVEIVRRFLCDLDEGDEFCIPSEESVTPEPEAESTSELSTTPPSTSISTEPPTSNTTSTEPPTSTLISTEPPTSNTTLTEPPTSTPLSTEPPTSAPTSTATEPPTSTPITTEPPTSTPISTEPPTSTKEPCDPPKYDAKKWNTKDDDKVYKNNCYNYATDQQNNAYAQPGHKTKPALNTPEAVVQAAKEDGLRGLLPNPGDDKFPDTNGDCLVALFFYKNPNDVTDYDYHWMRRDSDGNWSHKMDGLKATNKYKDKVITDPRKTTVNAVAPVKINGEYILINVGEYKFIGFMSYCPADIKDKIVRDGNSKKREELLKKLKDQ